jgi:hypothetical protein
MGYEIALDKAWCELKKLSKSSKYTIPFLTDIYEVKLSEGIILSESSSTPAKQDLSILILITSLAS